MGTGGAAAPPPAAPPPPAAASASKHMHIYAAASEPAAPQASIRDGRPGTHGAERARELADAGTANRRPAADHLPTPAPRRPSTLGPARASASLLGRISLIANEPNEPNGPNDPNEPSTSLLGLLPAPCSLLGRISLIAQQRRGSREQGAGSKARATTEESPSPVEAERSEIASLRQLGIGTTSKARAE